MTCGQDEKAVKKMERRHLYDCAAVIIFVSALGGAFICWAVVLAFVRGLLFIGSHIR